MIEATPAATLILLRDVTAGFELFMVERARSMNFAGGAMVFPGGKVDAQDALVAADARLLTDPAAAELADGAARIAAIRETFEEADVLLTDGPMLDSATRMDWRSRLVRHEADFAAFLRAVGHRAVPERLVPFAHWVPPETIRRRFDTLFYLAVMPEGETACHDGHETTHSRWVRPQDALRLADEGRYSLMFPTRRNIERIAVHDALEALITSTRAAPLRRIQPFIEQRDGVDWLCIPEDCGYPITAEPVAGMRRE